MNKKRTAIQALLDIYKNEVDSFSALISNFTAIKLNEITDASAEPGECRSRQSIIAHVISSGYTYATYIRRTKNLPGEFVKPLIRQSAKAFINDLDKMFAYTVESLQKFNDEELEETDHSKKIHAHWGKEYDVEQILEHAIVHVMRHQRQLQNLK